MPNGFSRYCFRQQHLEEQLVHFTIKANFNGCDALFGEPKCARMLDWTDGENAENVQVGERVFGLCSDVAFHKILSLIGIGF